MIDWTSIQADTGLISIVKSISGLNQVTWLDTKDQRVGTPQFSIAQLSLVSSTNGCVRAESKFAATVADPDGPYFETLTTVKIISIRVLVETYSQKPDKIAEQWIEAMRDRWQWLSCTTALAALGLGFVEFTPTQRLSIPKDGHISSRASADVRYNVISVDTDPTEYERIESADFSFVNGFISDE